ncbi:ComF family protein [Jiulongibacter sp. NS-SX5]|uniref:ComF family protein n=1 Tax=Jiulongibacter sp. NS-SX5 TaxID=3463854 RepID=UPI0040595126
MKSYESHICISCQLHLPKFKTEYFENEFLAKKFWGKIDIKNTYSFLQFSKNGPVQNILHNLKYRNKPDLAVFMGRWFGDDLKLKGLDEEIDLILGVPLHPVKKKRRGYNQADCFAEGLSEKLGVPHETELLVRNQFTETQTNKSRFRRFENMEGVFGVKNPEDVNGKRVALVDDVLTTGATLEVAGAELLKAGCTELTILTIAAAL